MRRDIPRHQRTCLARRHAACRTSGRDGSLGGDAVGGGGGRSGHAELAHSGKGYPENPTVAPARRVTDIAGADTVIPEFASFEEATPLPPE